MSSFQAESKQQICNLLMNTDLTDNWENIPQTLVVNCVIGLILFLMFVLMTHIAWHQSNSDNKENLISFLYGHRNPEKWYIIPRFEFLRRTDKPHNHELEWQNIYVPPKLPSANPMSLFEPDSQENESIEDTQTLVTIKMPPEKAKPPKKSPNSENMSQNQSSKGISTPTCTSSPLITNTELNPSNKRVESHMMGPKSIKLEPPDKSFFYPSILESGQYQASYLSKKLNLFFAKFFQVTDADMIYAKGIDAYEYLLFQRHLILIMLITNLICLGVILPVHWFSGDNLNSNLAKEAEEQANSYPFFRHNASFQHTTIKNMSPRTTLYWVHIVSSIFIVLVSLVILRSYRDSIINRNDSQLARRTLLVGNIAPEHRSRRKLHQIFREYFPHCKLAAVQFVYDIYLLEQYQLQLDAIVVAKEYCEKYKRKHNKEILVKPTEVNESQTCYGNCRLCSFLYICLCYWPYEDKVPATEYYAQQERHYRSLIKEACEKMVNSPSEYAFVTLKTHKQTKRVMRDLAKLKSDMMDARRTSLTRKSKLKSGSERERLATGSAPSSADNDFIQTSHNTLSDPLDPKNNPHVRSIRSPVGKEVESSTGKQNGQTSQTTDASKNLNGLKNTDLREQKANLNKLEGPLGWSVRYAPHPDNIEYYDILNIATTSKYTIALLHLLMVVIFIFFTTPNVLLSILDRLSVLKPSSYYGFLGVFMNYLTALVQIITTALLPYLIGLISKQIPYENSASKTHSTMWKVYLFLVLMVIVMPSIGMESALAIIYSNSERSVTAVNETTSPTLVSNVSAKTMVNQNNGSVEELYMGESRSRSTLSHWCLFPVDNGSYYVNYVISSIFLSTFLELIKPTDIISYYFILLTGRSVADYEGGRQFIQREFSISMQHTGVLLIFSVVMTYAISCPLIAPAGLLYLVIKHAVDHYHLFYTYFTKKTDKNLHHTMDIFVRVALLLMLFQTAVAILIKTGKSSFVYLSQIVFWTTLVVFLYNFFFDFTTRRANEPRKTRYQREFCACFYLPRVFEHLLRLDALPANCISRKI